jgi:hypothetical protein
LEEELCEEKKRNNKYEVEIRELEAEKHRLQAENRNLQGDKVTLQPEFDNMSEDDDFDDILGYHENSSTDLTNDLQVQFNNVKEVLQKCQDISNQEKQDIQKLELDLKTVTEERNKLSRNVATNNAALLLSEKERHNLDLQQLKSKSSKQLEHCVLSLQSTEQKLKVLERESDKTREDHNETLQTSAKEYKICKTNLQSAAENCKALEDQVSCLEIERKRQIEAHQAILQEYTNELMTTTQKAESTTKRCDQLAKQLVDMEGEKKKLNGELRSTKATLETHKVDLKAAKEQNQQLAFQISHQGHHYRILTNEIADPVQYAYDQFEAQSIKEYNNGMFGIAELLDEIKDHVTVVVVQGPDSEHKTRHFRSMRYSIPIADGLANFQKFVNQALKYELTPYAIQGIDRNIVKKCTDPDSLITVCESTGACYFGSQHTMETFTKHLPKSIGKRMAPGAADVDDRHVLLWEQEDFDTSKRTKIRIARKKRSPFVFAFEENTAKWPSPPSASPVLSAPQVLSFPVTEKGTVQVSRIGAPDDDDTLL